MSSVSGNFQVAIDATPLLGKPTGIGAFVRSVLLQEASGPNAAMVSAYALSLHGPAQLPAVVPPGMPVAKKPMPAGLLLRVWALADKPTLEQLGVTADVVHATNFVAPPGVTGTVVTVHDLTSVRYPEMCTATTLRYPRLIQRAIDNGAFIHSPTEAVANEVRNHFRVEPERVRAIHHGLSVLPPPAFAESPQSLGIASPYILVTGTIEPRKDYATLIRAFGRIAAKDTAITLVIAGERGWATDAFDAAISQSPHRDRIKILGYVPDTTRYALLRGARVLAFPSVYEGFGLPPLEAMQAATPVVASDIEAVREVCGPAVLYAKPGDEIGWSDALESALSDETVRSNLLQAGAERTKLYQWPQAHQQLRSLYAESFSASS